VFNSTTHYKSTRQKNSNIMHQMKKMDGPQHWSGYFTEN